MGWADATGTVVPGVYGQADAEGRSPIYIDPATGYVWRITEYGVLNAEPGWRVWLSTDCTGTALYQGFLIAAGTSRFVPPRVVFVMGAEYRVRNDDAAFSGAPTTFGSTDDIGSCSTNVNPGYALTAAQTTLVTKPTLSITGPLHPVLVGQP